MHTDARRVQTRSSSSVHPCTRSTRLRLAASSLLRGLPPSRQLAQALVNAIRRCAYCVQRQRDQRDPLVYAQRNALVFRSLLVHARLRPSLGDDDVVYLFLFFSTPWQHADCRFLKGSSLENLAPTLHQDVIENKRNKRPPAPRLLVSCC
jgi:hypothetical protein